MTADIGNTAYSLRLSPDLQIIACLGTGAGCLGIEREWRMVNVGGLATIVRGTCPSVKMEKTRQYDRHYSWNRRCLLNTEFSYDQFIEKHL